MKKPEIYYFVFLKKRNLNRLIDARYYPRAILHHSRSADNFLHRLSIQGILAAEYHCTTPGLLQHLCYELEYVDELFIQRPLPSSHNNTSVPAILVNYFPFSALQKLVSNRGKYLPLILKSFTLFGFSPGEKKYFTEEATELLTFMSHISSFLQSPRYILLAISAKSELQFFRCISLKSIEQ